MEISEEEYKLAKEAHVSNCPGGSIFEINVVCASIVSSYLIWSALIKRNVIKDSSFLPQFLLFVIPVLSALTIASDYSIYIPIGLATLGAFLIPHNTETNDKKEKKDEYKTYLTVYRAGTMILTCIAILAVDFQFFPRRFAKVETFGISLMDVGVGSFVFSSGIVGSRSYARKQKISRTIEFARSIRTALPILILGFSRLVLTRSVNYQEHHSEYGLHWNFFFTLGFLPPFVTLFGFLSQYISFFSIASVISVVYQAALCFGLQDWILNQPRVDLLTANKEGICSFFGYLAIFLFGLECGKMIFDDKTQSSKWISKVTDNEITQLSVRLFTYSLVMWSVFSSWIRFFPEYYISRGMANLPYVYCVIAFNLNLLSLIVFVQSKINIQGRGPSMLDAVNTNGLFTFLLANILTGVTNLSIRTLYVSDFNSSLINVIYMLIVCLVPWIMWSQFKIRVKL